jgi:hypothetical protein
MLVFIVKKNFNTLGLFRITGVGDEEIFTSY